MAFRHAALLLGGAEMRNYLLVCVLNKERLTQSNDRESTNHYENSFSPYLLSGTDRGRPRGRPGQQQAG